jgi:hypothetical protein
MDVMTQWSCLFDSRFGSFEQPVKQVPIQYKLQPGKIENYTPGKSSVSDKEAKQVTSDDRFAIDSVVTSPSSIIDKS